MIIRFKVDNYRSFKDETTIDFVSNSHIHFDDEHRYDFGRLHILKNTGIFGANASGKTTIVNAISVVRNFIMTGKIDNNIAFKGQANKPTKFSIVFENNNSFYEYSFAIRHNRQINFVEVLEESLYELKLSGSNILIYDRKTGTQNPDSDDFATFERGYQNTIGVLFLTYMSAPERIIKDSKVSQCFLKVYSYFARKVSPIVHENELLFSICEENINVIRDKLHEYDTGIESVDFVKPLELEKIKLMNDNYIKRNVIVTLLRDPNPRFDYYYSDGFDIFMFRKENKNITIKKLLFKHVNIEERFSFIDESEGTKLIFSLIATLLCSDNSDRTFFIDEIERSSHPVVVRQIIRDFQRANKGNKSQLIFTSHLNSLMDEVLQRDEIYFVEKDDFGASSVRSLQLYSSRNRRENISEKYLEGRYGALPNIGVDIN